MNRRLAWIDPGEPFPPTESALTPDDGANGLLAAGADLSAARLIEAYGRGIFPWFSNGEPVLWWTPSPRMVLMLDEFKVSKSFGKTIDKAIQDPEFEIHVNKSFSRVMQACAGPRRHGIGTWISGPMIDAYTELHDMGLAHSLEVYEEGQLTGGLYCVSLGRMVFGESMFSWRPNASKMALGALVAWLKAHESVVIDCQQRTDHLASLGGREIDRQDFESLVHRLTAMSALPWRESPPSKHDLARI